MRVRLVVQNERLRARSPEHVQPAVQQHVVDLEGERPLDAHALEPGDARGERRVAVRADVPLDRARPRSRSPPGTRPGRGSRGPRGRPGGRGRRARAAGARRRRARSHAARARRRSRPTGPTAPAACRRPAPRSSGTSSARRARGAVGEPGNAVERRLRNDGELAQAGRRRRDRLAGAFEQGQLAVRGDRQRDGLGPTGRRRARAARGRRGAAPSQRRARPRPGRSAAPLRASSRRPSRFSTHPIGVSSLASVGVPDRARDDQPLLRTRHRDVVETEALGLLRVLPVRLDVLVGDWC